MVDLKINLNKLILFLFVLFAVSCKKQMATQTRRCTADGVEIFNGNVKELIVIENSLNGEHFSKADTVFFDEKGDIIKESARHEINDTIRVTKSGYVNEYNSSDEKSRTIEYDTDYAFGRIENTSKLIFNYNSLGQVVSSEDNCQNKNSCLIDYFMYDHAGDCIEIKRGDEPDFVTSDSNKYYNHLLVETQSYLYFGKIREASTKQTYRYFLFDKTKNWVKMMAFLDGEKLSLTTRKITYY
jgi:hypothetical protein